MCPLCLACLAVLVLSVADSGSRELLAYYRLPAAHLRPFQHYHLELVQVRLSSVAYTSLSPEAETGKVQHASLQHISLSHSTASASHLGLAQVSSPPALVTVS